MNTDWRKLMRMLAIFGGAYLAALAIVADLAQVLTLKFGVPLLALLLLVVLGYVGWEQGRGLWRNYRAVQARLDEARDFLRRYGDNVWLCALARWLFEQHVDSIRVSDADQLQVEGIVILDVSQVSLRPDDHLEGMHFAIIGRGGGEVAKVRVKLCDSISAHLEPYEQTRTPCVGDLAVPVEPPEATDLERLLGNVLFIVSG